MLFNSVLFFLFFAIVYALYVALRRHLRAQNLLVLAASYVLYGYWDWRFLVLISSTIAVSYYTGLAVGNAVDQRIRRNYLLVSVVFNLGVLGFFKYFNFFAESFAHVLSTVGLHPSFTAIHIILPVGISFYTFQALSYTVDIYRGALRPTTDIISFAAFVSYFPQLVAGPIERAGNLLPQMERPRHPTWEQIDTGVFLIVWGLFKKLAIADNMAGIANQVFNNYTDYTGLDLALGVLAFTFQIYGDFSGYSDIARGLAKLMGFELMVNFRLPYFASNPSDFWARWHISLSSWLRDYLYIPLGGNRHGRLKTYRNLMITMLLGGLWHGAAWNFVLWGCFHGTILVIYRWLGGLRRSMIPGSTVNRAISIAVMFLLTNVGWILFRSESWEQIVYVLAHVSPVPSSGSLGMLARCALYLLPLGIVQLWQLRTNDLNVVTRLRPVLRSLVYSLLIAWCLLLGERESIEFVYFQF